MANVQDQRVPYEILIRFGADGSPVGAHVIYLRVVSIDGDVLKEEVLAAEPIDVDGFPTSTLMTNTTRDALATVGRLSSERDALLDEVERLKALMPAA